MRTIYLDCSMGAAGDMLMAALLELLPEKDTFLQKMQSLGLPGLEISAVPSVKCGITGTHMRVLIHGEEEGHPEHAVEAHAHSHADAPEAAHAHVHVHPHHHTDLDELTHRIAALEMKASRQEKAPAKTKEKNWLSQATLLASIIAGAWIIVTVLNLFK